MLRAPRLTQELTRIQLLALGQDDLRRVKPSVLIEKLQEAGKEVEKRAAVAAAIFVGTAQACLKGSYWSPSFEALEGSTEVQCGHCVRPISCLHSAQKMPSPGELKVTSESQRILTMKGLNPIDAALQLANGPQHRHVVVVRFSALEDPRAEQRRYSNVFEDQLFFRTTYFEATERLASEVEVHPNVAIGQGDVIYTSGVGVLRGPVEDGAPWLEKPTQIDVVWIGLPARPKLEEQELIANSRDRELVAGALDRAFAWSSLHGADAIVLPPLGCSTHGCNLPRLHVAGLIHEAAMLYRRHMPVVCVASDHPTHLEATWWDEFAKGVTEGRPTPEPLLHVPAIPLPPHWAAKKDMSQLLEKRWKQIGVWSTPGTPRRDVIRYHATAKLLALK